MSTNLEGLPEKRFFRTGEIAEYFDVSERTIRRWCDEGKLDFARISPRVLRIPRSAVVEIIRISITED